jgi:hypothetical protein
MSAVEDTIRAIVRDELAKAGAVRPETYDRDSLPRGFTSKEAFAAECRRLGLDPLIYKAGRSWRIPRTEWDRARRADRERRRGPRAAPAADPIDAALQKSGLRLVGRRT